MSSFEKALEGSSYAYDIPTHRNCMGCCQSDSDYIKAFQSGARWAREYTVEEICEWIIGDGEFIVRNHCPANLKRAIKSHFSEQRQSDNGE